MLICTAWMSLPFGMKVAARAQVLSGLTSQTVRIFPADTAGRSWKRPDDLGERRRVASARRARRDMARDALGALAIDRAQNVGLEIVDDVFVHRELSRARRIFWSPMRIRPFTVPSGTPMSSDSSTCV